MAIAKYTFLPWLRQGLAARIRETDDMASPTLERARLAVELKLATEAVETGAAGEATVQKSIQLAGPGDVVGVARRAIIRTEPNAGVHNFEPNMLAYLEFYEEDLLWRYTPAAESLGNARRLRPWLALVVLKKDEFELQPNPTGLARLSVSAPIAEVFHPETEHWAWAHVQISKHFEAENVQNQTAQTLGARPDLGLSRLVCPRKLIKNTPYTAFLIPAFETGRLAGLGQPTTAVPAQKASWQTAGEGGETVWPVYFQWDFSTGTLGDFESLVAALKPFQVPPDMATLPFDVSQPGVASIDAVEKETNLMGFEAALRPPDFVREPFPNGDGDVLFTEKLAEYLNLNADLNGLGPIGRDILNAPNPFFDSSNLGDDPVLVAPTYGQFHALVRRLGEAGAPEWLEMLNRDPRWRGASGLGSEVIRKEQEELMQQAWRQIGRINEANRRIRQARAVQLMAKRAFSKHFKPADDSELFALTGAAHGLMLGAAAARVALETQILTSRIPVEAHSAAFRRAARSDFSLVRKMDNRAVVSSGLAAQKVNSAATTNFNLAANASLFLSAATPRAVPPNAVSSDTASSVLTAAVTAFQTDATTQARAALFDAIDQTQPTVLNKIELKNAIDATAHDATTKAQAKIWVDDFSSFEKDATTGAAIFSMKNETFKTAFGDASTRRERGLSVVRKKGETAATASSISVASMSDIQQIQADFVAFSQKLDTMVPRALASSISDLVGVRARAELQLRPEKSLVRKVLHGIKFTRPGLPPRLAELVPIMAHPEYPQPAYDFLKQLSQDFILPQVERLPENSVSLMVTNRAFIEAFMTGLNHEMGRELLWREFPTDQRGSYFRQFWNSKDDPTTAEIERRPDVHPIHTWRKKLGQHSAQPLTGGNPDDPAEGNLVLVVRGDLLKKYPNTMVFAQKAKFNDGSDLEHQPPMRLLTDENVAANIKWPIFSGELAPDIYLFGFDLTVDQAKGHRLAADGDAGWFFCFKERPGQVKFGLDDYEPELAGAPETPEADRPIRTWDDLTWEDLAAPNFEELERFQITFSKNRSLTNPLPSLDPVARWGDNSADLAAILYQDPVLYARHAAEMLF